MFKEKEEPQTPEIFKFSSDDHEVRSLMINSDPWIVAKDVCDILELSDTEVALRRLDEDEKLTRKIYASGQKRRMWLVNESGLYALILRSNKPEAKTFRKWITAEVLPAIRKKGYYKASTQKQDYLDACDIPYSRQLFNDVEVRFIVIKGIEWFSLNDVHKALKTTTESTQAAKKLNRKQKLAQKILLFGSTHPAWFVNLTGVNLLLAASRTYKSENHNQLLLGGAS